MTFLSFVEIWNAGDTYIYIGLFINIIVIISIDDTFSSYTKITASNSSITPLKNKALSLLCYSQEDLFCEGSISQFLISVLISGDQSPQARRVVCGGGGDSERWSTL